jgi:hypothetical protein
MKDERTVAVATLLRQSLRQSGIAFGYDPVTRTWTHGGNKVNAYRSLMKSFADYLYHSQHMLTAAVQAEIKDQIERGY